MGLKEDHQKLLDELGIPRDKQHEYFIPLDIAEKADLSDDESDPVGTDVEAFNEGYRSGYEDGYNAALAEHGLAPDQPAKRRLPDRFSQ
jgi:hypothetical protein